MPVDDIFWDVGSGADYHLVPGLSSPIHIRATVEHFPLTGFRNRVLPGLPAEPFPEGRALESRVEAEARVGQGRVAVSGEAGLQLLRRLDGRDAGSAALAWATT